ncbi:Asph [Symbiodinium sp. CCMP2592]|nr:Asph [Symbiodinium sp. CCMP2592]
MKEHLRQKTQEARMIFDRVGAATRTGLLASILWAWQCSVIEGRKLQSIQNQVTEASLEVDGLKMRQSTAICNVQMRTEKLMDSSLVISVISAWSRETKENHLEKFYSNKVDSKRKQLTAVQTLFKSFARDLEEIMPEPPDLPSNANAVTYADGDQEDWPIHTELLASARVSALGRMQMPQQLSGLQLQRPSFLFPGLKARPFWPREDFPKVVNLLEARAPRLSAEVRQLLADGDCSTDSEERSPPCRISGRKRPREEAAQRRRARPVTWQPQGEGLHSGVWLKLEIWSKGGLASDKAAPETEAAVSAAMDTGEAMTSAPGRAALSLLTPEPRLGATIMPHCGPTNHRLRLHLPLLLPGGAQRMSGLKVAGETRDWELHRCLVFDDSFEHEIQLPPRTPPAPKSDGEPGEPPGLAQEARVVLLLDLWHPDADENLRSGSSKPVASVENGFSQACTRLHLSSVSC